MPNDYSGGVHESVGDAKYGIKSIFQSITRQHMLILLAVVCIFIFVFSDYSDFIMSGKPTMNIIPPKPNMVKPLLYKYNDIESINNDKLHIREKTLVSATNKQVSNLRALWHNTYQPHSSLTSRTIDVTQIYYIKSGIATFKLGDVNDEHSNIYIMNENDSIIIPNNSIFTIINDTDNELELIVTSIAV